ncbi:hypothetical protein P170DRAFT_431917 [Aspergillus steynii IBT 23096]|uniref:DUF3074 domain-containing protein n=1 Tax=Aspergillus steynii IBT 23096 TaxID=1392250 RepID=A0A2I2GN25_9EURO|nr:uncharacterized protein P170DRAFT_431917 [Aspergillus steynii IBT 23096]PLB54288.1 hypothetical protein P170DRAFT_431917 [Aspergillus steynii IBT 23096]
MRSSLLHVTPHPFSILPSHSSLDDTSSPRPPLREFLCSVLADATQFLGSIPDTFQSNREQCPSPPASAPVQVSSRIIRDSRPDSIPEKEFWYCRNSIHTDASVDGSASWKEFQEGLKTNHAENEMAYTPSVTAVDRVLEWPSEREIEGGWRDVDMQGMSPCLLSIWN